MRTPVALLALLLAPQEDAGRITGAAVKEHVAFLASDAMGGRETGSDELVKAAEYVAARFGEAGLKPLGDGGTHLAWWAFGAKKAPNCAGLLEGGDPKLREEVLVIGANMDHLGRRGGAVFHGADANASGTAGVIELARAFGALKERPKRPIVFAAFSGGEQGMLGSAAFAADPRLPAGKIVAMFNLDMIGRSKAGYLFAGGVGTSPDWKDRVERLAGKHDLALETGPGGKSPTDSVNFYRRGVPVLTFTTNVHEDYHRPGDVAEKIDAGAEAKILRMVFEVVLETAQAGAKPEFRKNDSEAVPKDFYERLAGGPPPPKPNRVRLGVNIDAVPQGAKLTSVQEGSPAGEAGLKVGDILTKIGDQKVATQADVVAALGKFNPGDKTKVVFLRNGKEQEVEVRFPAN